MENGLIEEILKEPVGSKKMFKMGLNWFISSLIAAAAFHWLLLEPFGLASKIFKENSMIPWVYFITLSFIIAALITSIRFYQYYRSQYHIFRLNSLVDNLYASRATIQAKYHSILNEAEERFYVAGLSLHTLIGNRDTRNLIFQAATSKKIKFKFLFHHHSCTVLKERALQEDKFENKISDDAKLHLKQAIKMQDRIITNNGSCEIRLLKGVLPDCFYLIRDNILYIEPYLFGYSGRDCPVISLKKNETNKIVFSSWEKAFDYKWTKANDVEVFQKNNCES